MSHRRPFFIATLIFFLFNGPSAIAFSKEALRNAATLFEQERYNEALAIWRGSAVKNGTGNLFYNIGLAESRLGHVPEAIYAFEQAIRLQPANRDYANALKAERKKLDDATIPVEPFFLGKWISILLSVLRPGTWVFLGLLIGMITLVLSIPDIKQLTRLGAGVKPNILLFAAITGGLFLLLGVLSYQRLYSKNEAVVMQKCEIRQAASNESPTLRNVSAGEKVFLKDEFGDWVYISLLNLDYGWMKKECLKTIQIR